MPTTKEWTVNGWVPFIDPGNVGGISIDDVDGLEARLAALEGQSAALHAKVVGDGVTDDLPAIQAIYDAGFCFTGKQGPGYRLVGCLFIDQVAGKDGLYQHPFIEPVAPLIFDDLPQVQAIDGTTGANVGSAGARIGIAVGWKRTAWDRTANVVKMAMEGAFSTKSYYRNTASDSDGTPFAFEIRNTTFRAPEGTTLASGETNAIVVQSIAGGMSMRNVTVTSFRAGIAQRNYTDLLDISHCHTEQGPGQWLWTDGRPGTALTEMVDYGDGLSIRNCKSNGAFIARLERCRGGVIESCVSGRYEILDCEAIFVTALHNEDNIIDAPSFLVTRSGITWQSCQIYARDTGNPVGTTTLGANIEVDDDKDAAYNDSASTLSFRDTSHIRRIEMANQLHGPLIHFVSTHRNTEVTADGLEAHEVANNSPGFARRSPLYFATAVASSITTSLATKETQLGIATGRFIFSPAGNVWAARNPQGTVDYVAPVLAAPDLTGLTSGGSVAGSLGNAVSYQYAVAFENAPGYATAPVTKTQASSASGAVKMEVRGNKGPALMYIWRAPAAGNVLTAPTHYVVVPVRRRDIYGWDLGTTVFGLPWQTTSIPARPTATTALVRVTEGVATPI